MMSYERRTRGGLALRSFFDAQLHQLHSLFSHWEKEPPICDPHQTREVVEEVVDLSDKRLRAISGYRDKLRASACCFFSHVCDIVSLLPSPIVLAPNCFGTTPVLNALFVTPEEITDLIERSKTEDVPSLPSPLHGFISVEWSEKTRLGYGISNGDVRSDVAQTWVNFCHHQLIAIAPTPQASDHALIHLLFDEILSDIADKLNLKMRQQKIQHHSRPDKLINSLNNPEVYLKQLTEELEQAKLKTSLNTVPFLLSRQGQRIAPGETSATNEFSLSEIQWPPEHRKVLQRVTFSFP